MKNLCLFLTLIGFSALAADFPVTINSCGHPVTFKQPPQRAVIHDINMAEMAFALNLQNRIVGLTGITGWYKMTPEFQKKMGQIPELAPKYPSLETLLAANTDFFFAGWNYGMKVGGDVTPEKLSPYGISTFVLSESCIFAGVKPPKASMDLLYNDQHTLGKIFGKEKEALALIDEWKRRLMALPQRAVESSPLKVFIYDSGEDKPFTSGKYAMPTAIIEAAGGQNIMDSLEASWTSASWEAVAAANPDFIILLDYQNGSDAETLRRFLESHPLMKLTSAVKQRRYLKLQYAELTPGPANIVAVEKLAYAMYGGDRS
ncbi:ABC transporter substrate-binding protein [Budvicia diplopodorum]|uniref:ABC transporter substrate-binding protein n=1 Tax=Budvicia diplopodorum TaxID=1119056 RepID=UPI001359EDBE|nr:ABC transporter substrate-binding protein [Budvicia diplopodorum]